MPDSSGDISPPKIDLHDRQYWTFQLIGWSAMALLSYLSLTVWYNPGEIAPALHTVLQSAIGILVSHPLRRISQLLWHRPIRQRALFNALAVLCASLVWTALRISTFTWLTGEVIPATDLGGWIFASVIVFGAWSFCYHAFKYYRQSMDEQRLAAQAQNMALRAAAEAEKEKVKRLGAEAVFRETQMRMLKYQLNPHFFLNALNSVSSLVQRGDREAAMQMLARIGDFLRLSLADPEETRHSLAEELDALQTYLDIEMVRFGDRLQTEFEVDPTALQASLPCFLLQPLFENAIKHAVGKSLGTTTLILQAGITGDRLTLEVSDNGPGINPGQDGATTDQGIGLINVQQRLESAYGDNYGLDLSANKDGGLSVSIDIPST